MGEPERRLGPPATKDKLSVARVTDDWYVVATSRELGRRPVPFTLLGTPLVIFRGEDGRPGALLDCCPHRNAPLSIGRVQGDRLECRYHGWQFDREGSCRAVPGLADDADGKGRRVTSFAAVEQDGFVWVYATPDAQPVREPYRFPHLDDGRYTTVRAELDLAGTLHAAAENALDVPHTAFLHQGLFRGAKKRHEIEVVVRRWHDRVEAEYIGEPRPSGVIGRLLAPKGGVVTHFDRFLLPSIAQVEYALGESHIMATTALTPIGDFQTRLFGVVSFKMPLPVPGRLLAGLFRPVGLRILRQDAEILERQAENIRRFGGEQYVSTEIDTLGPHILRLLRNAERGDRTPVGEPQTRSLTMLV